MPTTTTVTHRSGLSFAAQIDEHELVFDQPVHAGGADSGPSPLDLLGAALGGCVSLYVFQFLAGRHQNTEGLRVEVTQVTARAPHRIARFEVRIVLPEGVLSVYLPLVEAVARVCPVHNTLAGSAEIAVAVEETVLQATP